MKNLAKFLDIGIMICLVFIATFNENKWIAVGAGIALFIKEIQFFSKYLKL